MILALLLIFGPLMLEPDGMVVRQIWVPASDPQGISPNGQSVSYVDWSTGDLAVRDLATGTNRRLTNKGSWRENPNEYAGYSSVISPDGKQVAYLWFDYNKDPHSDLRVVPVMGEGDGSKPRVLYRNAEVEVVEPTDWSPDGKHVLVIFTRKDKTKQIGLVAIEDGSVQVLKTLDWRYPGHARFSPDGRYIAYDFPTQQDSPGRDIFLLATDGSREIPLVAHPGDDSVLDWPPDGKRVLFASDRRGSWDAWLVHVADGKPQGKPELIKTDIGRNRPLGFTQNGSFYYAIGSAPSKDVYVATLDPTTGKVLGTPKKISQRFEGRNKSPDWSRDGKYLAYVSVRGRFQETLVIRSVETGKEREVPLKMTIRGKGHFRWSPDGRYLLAAGQDQKGRDGLYRIDVQTGEVTQLVQNYFRTAAWSFDGKVIFYRSYEPSTESSRIMARDLESGQEKEIYRYRSQMSSGRFLRVLAVSPDGLDLALCRSGVLQVIPTTGGQPRELFKVPKEEEGFMSVTWMPDGRELVCNKGGELWRISAKGGDLRTLGTYNLKVTQTSLSVHPDGRHIAFTARNPQAKKPELWVMENFLPPLKPSR